MSRQGYEYWKEWITAIAANTTIEAHAEHISRHATVDLARDLQNGTMQDWHASMLNLMAISQLLHFKSLDVGSFLPLSLDLLGQKYAEDPSKMTPPPGPAWRLSYGDRLLVRDGGELIYDGLLSQAPESVLKIAATMTEHWSGRKRT